MCGGACVRTSSATLRSARNCSRGKPTRYSMTGSNRTGNNHRSIVVQERDRHLLRELGVMRVVDREQAKTVAGFGSITRVNARLLALTRAGLLRRFFAGTTAGGAKALYALSAKGAQLIGVPL